MGKSKTDTGYDDLRKRRSIKNKPKSKAPPLTCPPKRMFAFRCSGGSFNEVLYPGYMVGVVSWDPPYGTPVSAIPLSRGNLINGQNPQSGDHFEVPATILSTDCVTGVQTMRNIPTAHQGHYYVSHVENFNSGLYPANHTPTEFVDYHLSTAPPCTYIGNPLKVCLCSVGPGGTGVPGQIFDAMVTGGSLSGWMGPGGVQLPGRFFGCCTVDGATAVVGQEIEITQAGGIDNFMTSYANWAWPPAPGVGNIFNISFTLPSPFPAQGMTDLIGVLKVMEVYPQFDYWNPPATHSNPYGTWRSWVFNSAPAGSCAGVNVCAPTPVCDQVAWNAIPYAYFTEWNHIPSMFYNPPIVLNPWWAGPGGYTSPSSGGTNFPVGGPIWNYDANIDYPNQSSICEWCDDWNANGAVPGTFDNRVIAWGYTLTQAEAFCTCCPNWFISPPGPLEIPPTGFTN